MSKLTSFYVELNKLFFLGRRFPFKKFIPKCQLLEIQITESQLVFLDSKSLNPYSVTENRREMKCSDIIFFFLLYYLRSGKFSFFTSVHKDNGILYSPIRYMPLPVFGAFVFSGFFYVLKRSRQFFFLLRARFFSKPNKRDAFHIE